MIVPVEEVADDPAYGTKDLCLIAIPLELSTSPNAVRCWIGRIEERQADREIGHESLVG